jgi:hypothetical protein
LNSKKREKNHGGKMAAKKNVNPSTKDMLDEKIVQRRHIQEIIEKSHQGVIVDDHAPLQKKSQDLEVLAKLLEIERSIIERAYQKGILKG